MMTLAWPLAPYRYMLSVLSVEDFHGSLALLVDVLAAQDVADGHPDDFAVEQEGDVVDVPDVELEFARPADGVAAVDLCPAGDSGGDEVAAALGFVVQGEVLDEQGARADEAHVSLEDVDELGEFVDGGGAHELADGGEALGVGEELALRVLAVVHGFELDDLKDVFVFAGPRLGEEDVASVRDGEQEAGRDEDGREQNEQQQGCDAVAQGLDEAAVHETRIRRIVFG